jgi:hypothetical protein
MDKKIINLIKIVKRSATMRTVAMNLSGEEGKRIVMSAAKRVIQTHSEVIKALAKR